MAFDIFEYLKPIMNTTESNGNTNILIAKEEIIWKIKDWEENEPEFINLTLCSIVELDSVILNMIGITFDILSPDVITMYLPSRIYVIAQCPPPCTSGVCPLQVLPPSVIELKKRK